MTATPLDEKNRECSGRTAGLVIFVERSCGHTQRSSVGRCGKADDEGGSLPVGIVVAENFSSVLLHNAIADAEAEAGSPLPTSLVVKKGSKMRSGWEMP